MLRGIGGKYQFGALEDLVYEGVTDDNIDVQYDANISRLAAEITEQIETRMPLIGERFVITYTYYDHESSIDKARRQPTTLANAICREVVVTPEAGGHELVMRSTATGPDGKSTDHYVRMSDISQIDGCFDNTELTAIQNKLQENAAKSEEIMSNPASTVLEPRRKFELLEPFIGSADDLTYGLQTDGMPVIVVASECTTVIHDEARGTTYVTPSTIGRDSVIIGTVVSCGLYEEMIGDYTAEKPPQYNCAMLYVHGTDDKGYLIPTSGISSLAESRGITERTTQDNPLAKIPKQR